MTDDEYHEIVSQSSAAVQDLTFLGAKDFLEMRPQELARFLGSEVLSLRLEKAMNEPKKIVVVRRGNVEESVKVFDQDGLEKLLREAQYLIHVDGPPGSDSKYVSQFRDLKMGRRYTFDESVSRYETLRRDLETFEQQDSERGMIQVKTDGTRKLSLASSSPFGTF